MRKQEVKSTTVLLFLKHESLGLTSSLIELEPNSTPMIPSIVIEHMGNDEPKVTAPDTNQVAQTVQHDAIAAPGAFPAKPVPTIPEWYTVGWRQNCSIDKPPVPEGEEKDNNILHTFIGEQYYGAWYHNAGIIVFVCVYHPPLLC